MVLISHGSCIKQGQWGAESIAWAVFLFQVPLDSAFINTTLSHALFFFFLMLRKNRHVGVYKREKNTAELEHVVMMLRHKKAWPQNEALKICANPYLYTQRPTVIVMIIMHLIAVWDKCLHTRIQEWKRKGYEWIQHRGGKTECPVNTDSRIEWKWRLCTDEVWKGLWYTILRVQNWAHCVFFLRTLPQHT